MLSNISRRRWLQSVGAAIGGGSLSGWLPVLASEALATQRPHRACIVLWMQGGPAQTDTFDMKPGSKNGGEFRPIATSAPGIQICEHLPRVARHMTDLAIIRSMQTKEGDHGRATSLLHTGYTPIGPIKYPTLGALVSNELASADVEIPRYVTIGANGFPFGVNSAADPGFLGPNFAPFAVTSENQQSPSPGQTPNASTLRVANLKRFDGVTRTQFDNRLEMLASLQRGFYADHPSNIIDSHRGAYARAARMVLGQAPEVFDLSREPKALRDAYGDSVFGQGCLLARRLVERGVSFVEVTLENWDTHQRNFPLVRGLCERLDPAWSTLLLDLKSRGLLDSTLVVWMGEFGRTPRVNPNGGRDHFPAAWTTVLGGGGIRGGQCIGRTTADGTEVDDRPVTVGDLMATVFQTLGLDARKQNMSNAGRPIRLADPEGKPIPELLA